MIHGFVKTGIRIEIGAKAHANGLQIFDEIVLLEVHRAVERGVFNEVRVAALIVVFENGTRVDGQPQFGAFGRQGVPADVIFDAVW